MLITSKSPFKKNGFKMLNLLNFTITKMMKIANVPVMFWGHTFPGDGKDPYVSLFNIRCNPITGWWSYTPQSAFRGDTPYSKWINETFKPDYKNLEEGVEHIELVRQLIVDKGNPLVMKFSLRKKLKFPEEVKKQLSEWKYWLDEPEPDTSAYYIDIDLDKDKWQCEDAPVKTSGHGYMDQLSKIFGDLAEIRNRA